MRPEKAITLLSLTEEVAPEYFALKMNFHDIACFSVMANSMSFHTNLFPMYECYKGNKQEKYN